MPDPKMPAPIMMGLVAAICWCATLAAAFAQEAVGAGRTRPLTDATPTGKRRLLTAHANSSHFPGALAVAAETRIGPAHYDLDTGRSGRFTLIWRLGAHLRGDNDGQKAGRGGAEKPRVVRPCSKRCVFWRSCSP